MADTRDEMAGKTAGRRQWGSGSIYHRPDKGWRVSISLPPEGRKRRRREWQFATREAAERKLAAVQTDLMRGLPPEEAMATYPIRPGIRPRMLRDEAVRLILARARALAWSDDFTAQAVAAGLTRTRVQFGVTGPCVYCGDELAATVDHVDPNGGDGRENVVSACLSCNASKGKRTPAEWKRAA